MTSKLDHLFSRLKGGSGSGNWGHGGRPGKHGGSVSGPGAGAAGFGGSNSIFISEEVDELYEFGDITEKDWHDVNKALPRYQESINQVAEILPKDHIENVDIELNMLSQGHGFYDADNNILSLDATVKPDVGIVAHEIGHKVWYKNISDKTRNNIENEFDASIKGEVKDKVFKAHTSGKKLESFSNEGWFKKSTLPSVYGGTNKFEYFSEAYKMFAQKPTVLKERNERLYNIMKNEVFR